MNSTPPEPRDLPVEELLRLDAWLHDLVATLAGNEVENVVQDTWVAALARPPRDERLKAWLARVARNFALRSHIARRRRLERETRAARPEALPSAEELLEVLELQRRVARAVNELREPHRTAVLLRYSQRLSVSEIAARTGTTQVNVRQRLKRGLDTLRTGLREAHGVSWRDLPAIATLTGPIPTRSTAGAVGTSQSVPWLWPGVIEMKKATVLTGLLLVAATAVVFSIEWQDPLVPDDGSAQGAQASALASVDLEGPQGVDPAREALDPPTPIAVAASDAGLEAGTLGPVVGRVLDRLGQPLAGIGLAAVPDFPTHIPAQGVERAEPTSTSAADGSFELASDLEYGHVAPARGWVPVAGLSRFGTEADRRGDRLLVLVPAVELAGQVTDAEGRPLEGVGLSISCDWKRDFPDALVGTSGFDWLKSVTDAEGRFEHKDLPAGVAHVRFEKEGYETKDIEVGTSDESGLQVVLVSRSERPLVLTGWVLEPAGAPLARALVGLGERTVEADDEGRFEFTFSDESTLGRNHDLFAAKPGWRTKVIEGFGAKLLDDDDRQLEFEIVMDGQSLAIQGRIVDAAGSPAKGIHIYLWGEQALMGGRSAEEFAVPADNATLNVGMDPGGALRVWALSGDEGYFRLEGLGDREYKLRLFDRERHAALTTEPIQAGSEQVLLSLPADFVRERFQGRVVDLAGRPVVGAAVNPMLVTFVGGGFVRQGIGNHDVRTDDEGRFTLRGISRRDLSLMVTGEGILLSTHDVPALDPGTDFEISVERQCHFRLILTDADQKPLQFDVLDARGEQMQIVSQGGGEYMSTVRWLVTGGRTQVFTVGESAATLLLLRWNGAGWDELDRLPLSLQPGDVNEIRW